MIRQDLSVLPVYNEDEGVEVAWNHLLNSVGWQTRQVFFWLFDSADGGWSPSYYDVLLPKNDLPEAPANQMGRQHNGGHDRLPFTTGPSVECKIHRLHRPYVHPRIVFPSPLPQYNFNELIIIDCRPTDSYWGFRQADRKYPHLHYTKGELHLEVCITRNLKKSAYILLPSFQIMEYKESNMWATPVIIGICVDKEPNIGRKA